MPEPITSIASKDTLDCHVDDSALDAPPPKLPEPLACTAEPAQSSASSAGTHSLVARFSPPAPSTKPAASSILPVISYSALTSSTAAVPGGSSYRASALNVQVEAGPFKTTLEVGTIHAQSGPDADLQVTALRRTSSLSGHGFGISVTGEAGALRINKGENNDDGGIGGNIGASAELIGYEATVDTPAGSVTYGQGLSKGVSGSMGVRDADHDGDPEFCAKFSLPAFTVGACLEQFW
ncbi:MAG TPA: hypothetical protein VFK05_33875 [Polyangiaceae bacterium]|nr:hypothetical protein [Polyangiaceae bacterium]